MEEHGGMRREVKAAGVKKGKRVYYRQRYTRMKAERERMGLTLRQVSRRIGLSDPFLSQVENGLVEPKLRNALKLAKGLRAALDHTNSTK